MAGKMTEKKVLVIDDEDFIRDLVKDFLELDGIQCEGADNPDIAIELVSKMDFNLILLDRNLGKIKAEDFIAKIKEIRRHIPILILTGDQHCDNNYIKGIGADGLIYKPFQVSEFMECIRHYLEMK